MKRSKWSGWVAIGIFLPVLISRSAHALPLKEAIVAGDYEEVFQQFEGESFHCPNLGRCTPRHCDHLTDLLLAAQEAEKRGHLDTASLVRKRLRELDVSFYGKRSTLGEIQSLVLSDGFDVNMTDREGHTLLFYVLSNIDRIASSAQTAMFLLSHGASASQFDVSNPKKSAFLSLLRPVDFFDERANQYFNAHRLALGKKLISAGARLSDVASDGTSLAVLERREVFTPVELESLKAHEQACIIPLRVRLKRKRHDKGSILPLPEALISIIVSYVEGGFKYEDGPIDKKPRQ